MKVSRMWSSSFPVVEIVRGTSGFRLCVQAIGLVLLANLLLGALWTYPRWHASEPDRQEAERIADARELVGPAISRARETYGCVLEAEKDLKDLRGAIASRSGSTAEAVEGLRQMVADVGLSVAEVTHQPEAIEELGLLELQTKLPVTGSYGSVRELIASLATEGPFVAIDRIALTAPDESGSGGPLSVELGLSTFVVESPMEPPLDGAGNHPGRESTPSDGSRPVAADPWATLQEVRDRLGSLPPLPAPAESFAVGLSRLQDRPLRDHGVARNLFAFDAPPSEPRVEPPPVQETPVPSEPVRRPPRVAFELIGIVDMKSGRRATFTDASGLYVVGVGEELPDGTVVVSVGVDYAELEVGGTRVRLTLESQSP